MTFGSHLVAFDTGIHRASLFSPRPLHDEHLGPFLMDAAKAGVFKLLFLNSVFDELMRQGDRDSVRSWMEDVLLDTFCTFRTPPMWPLEATAEELNERKDHFWQILRHEADAVVAVEVWKHQPDYFIHCNPAHWIPEIEPHLGGVRFVTPRQFVNELGLNAPRPPGKRGV